MVAVSRHILKGNFVPSLNLFFFLPTLLVSCLQSSNSSSLLKLSCFKFQFLQLSILN
ncbi:hypothetical protein RchiOBHm_Chr2g0099301 [Rosa chinensis]|uniref:Uncharacterized protein n=1 Tax=Rosa chinensis TaxID=74649 RepID=A0A2P6RLU1_ROSCH|nr:hypothetical protein RchiOBHm_Chr2g0099301 [Rosa chinensis]